MATQKFREKIISVPPSAVDQPFPSYPNGTRFRSQITDYRSKNNHIAFDPSTNRLAWTTTDTSVSYYNFEDYIYFADLHIPSNEKIGVF
jgi:hypothetical protein